MKYIYTALLALVAIAAYAADPVSLQQMLQLAPKETAPQGQTSVVTVRGGVVRRFPLMSTARLVPVATTTTPGVVKVGTGLAVMPDGTLNNTGVAGVASFNGRGGAVTPASGDYSIGQISGAATVASTGSYADLSNKPTIPAAQVNSDWNAGSGVAQILNKPTIPTSLSQLSQTPSYRTVTDAEKDQWNNNSSPVQSFNGRIGAIQPQSGDYTAVMVGADVLGSATSVQTNLNAHTSRTDNPHAVTKAQVGLSNVDNTTDLSKPISTATQSALDLKANTSVLAPVATSGAYADLTGKPTIPAAQVNSDWTAASGVAQILNKPTLGTAAAKDIPASGDASSTQVVLGSDLRLTNARTPTAHAASHGVAGSDPLKGIGFDAYSTSLRTASAAAPTKSAPEDSDRMNLWDSVTGAFRKLSWSNIKTALSGIFQQSAHYPVKNVLSLGILNNGSDQSAAIQALFNAAAAGDTFYFPKGTYGLSVKLTLPQETPIRIIGDGIEATTFKALSAMTAVFYKAGGSTVVQNSEFRDFSIDCNMLAGIGMELQTYKRAKLNRIYVTSYTGDAAFLFGKSTGSGGVNMFYEGQISEIGTMLPTYLFADQSTRGPYGLHFQLTASDNRISKVVTAYAKTAGIYDESYGNNSYVQIHPWGTSSYPTAYGLHALGRVAVSGSEFDTCATAGVKVGSYGYVSVTGNLFTNNTPIGVEIASGAANVAIMGNTYEGVTSKYTGTPGAGFTFLDGVTFGTAAGNLVQLDGSAKVPTSALPTFPANISCSAGQHVSNYVASTGTFTCTADTTSATGAPTDATYIMQTPSSGTSAEQALSSLSTGFLRVTTGTGVLTSDTNTYYKSGDLATFSRVVMSGSSLSSGVSPFAVFPTVTNASIMGFGGTNQNVNSNLPGLSFNFNFIPSTALTGYTAYYFTPVLKASSGTSYNVTTYDLLTAQASLDSAYSGTVTTLNTFNIQPPTVNGGSGVITTARGLNIGNFGTGEAINTGTGVHAFGDSLQLKNITAPSATTDRVKLYNVEGDFLHILDEDGNDHKIGQGRVEAKVFVPTIPAAATDAATVTFDLKEGDSPSVTLGGNRTLAFSNPQVGAWYALELKQDATGGRTVTWPSTGLVCTFLKEDGTTTTTGPTLHTAPNTIDTVTIHVTSATTARCMARGY